MRRLTTKDEHILVTPVVIDDLVNEVGIALAQVESISVRPNYFMSLGAIFPFLGWIGIVGTWYRSVSFLEHLGCSFGVFVTTIMMVFFLHLGRKEHMVKIRLASGRTHLLFCINHEHATRIKACVLEALTERITQTHDRSKSDPEV